MLTVFLIAYATLVLTHTVILAFHEDGTVPDMLLTMIGGLFIVMYVVARWALHSSIVVPFFQFWNLYPLAFLLFFIRGFSAPRIAMLRTTYLLGGAMLILPTLLVMGMLASVGAYGG